MDNLVKKIRTSSGDLQIDYNSLANLPTISNPNLLINGDFQVWQRGDTFGNHENAYCADRWLINNANYSTYSVTRSTDVPENECMQNSIRIVEKNNANTYLRYNFEKALRGTYTLSFWYKSTVVINTYIVDNGESVLLCSLPATGVWTRAAYYFTASSLSKINLIQAMNIGECYITGVKLEAGMTATQFVPRTYAEELALCRRYYQTINLDRLDVVCYLQKRNVDEYGGFVHFEVMRAIPTVTKTGTFFVEQYNNTSVYSVEEDRLTHLHMVPQLSGLKFGIKMSTSDPVNYLAVLSDSAALKFDAEIY